MAIGIHAAVNGQPSVRQVAGQTAGAPSPKLVRTAHEFEGMMMKELLKPMTAGNGLTGDDEDDSGSGSALGEFAGEALGQGLSQQGGFGIADRIVSQLSHSGNTVKNGRVTEKMHSNTVMGAAE
jgi:Rod binding domain-containing protein